MNFKRLTLFAGHYGSGKTNIALNYARWLKKQIREVTIADLDIVNPYFRTKDSEQALAACGIKLICSPYANSNLDVPAMPKEIYGLISDTRETGVLDIGGDDRGALALGRYAADIKAENNYEMLFVINQARPLTATAEDAADIMREIEYACSIKFTAVVNNTNIGPETTADYVLESADYAAQVCKLSGLPLKMTCVNESLCDELKGRIADLFPLSIQKLYYMINAEVPD